MRPLITAILFGSALGVIAAGPIVSACTPAQVEAGENFARSAATFVSKSDPILRTLYEEELNSCLAQKTAEDRGACVNSVRDKWRPIRESLTEVRAAWCLFEPAKCGPVDGGSDGSR